VDANALPRFADLTNDVDRELKAITRKPGTYNLICNPGSFRGGGEGDPGGEGVGGNYVLSTGPTAESGQPAAKDEDLELDSDIAWDSILNLPSPPVNDDPDVVILRRFEEPTSMRRNATPSQPPRGGERIEFTQPSVEVGESSQIGPQRIFDWMDRVDNRDLVAENLAYHRRFIGPRLMRMHDARLHPKRAMTFQGLDLDPFESESVNFPPVSLADRHSPPPVCSPSSMVYWANLQTCSSFMPFLLCPS